MEKQRAEQIREDMNTEWWRANEVDQFNLKDKLLRVGCRPLKRKYLECKKNLSGLDGQTSIERFGECAVSHLDLTLMISDHAYRDVFRH